MMLWNMCLRSVGVWFHSSTHRKAVAKVVLHLVVYVVFEGSYVVVGSWVLKLLDTGMLLMLERMCEEPVQEKVGC